MLFCFVLETISLNDRIGLYLVSTDYILIVLSSDWLRFKRRLARKMQDTYVYRCHRSRKDFHLM